MRKVIYGKNNDEITLTPRALALSLALALALALRLSLKNYQRGKFVFPAFFRQSS
jgi:hypothetical protein